MPAELSDAAFVNSNEYPYTPLGAIGHPLIPTKYWTLSTVWFSEFLITRLSFEEPNPAKMVYTVATFKVADAVTGLVAKTALAPAGKLMIGNAPVVPIAQLNPPNGTDCKPALYTSIISISFGEWIISVITRFGISPLKMVLKVAAFIVFPARS